jgi:hypothetical protein
MVSKVLQTETADFLVAAKLNLGWPFGRLSAVQEWEKGKFRSAGLGNHPITPAYAFSISTALQEVVRSGLML